MTPTTMQQEQQIQTNGNQQQQQQIVRESQFKNQWKICFTNFQRFFMRINFEARSLNQEKAMIKQFQIEILKKSQNKELFKKIQEWIKKEKLNSKKSFLHALKGKDQQFKDFVYGSLHIFLNNKFYQKIVSQIYPEKNIQKNEKLLRKFLDDNLAQPFPFIEERIHEQEKTKNFQKDQTQQERMQNIFQEIQINQDKFNIITNINFQSNAQEQQQIIEQQSQFYDSNNFNHLQGWQPQQFLQSKPATPCHNTKIENFELEDEPLTPTTAGPAKHLEFPEFSQKVGESKNNIKLSIYEENEYEDNRSYENQKSAQTLDFKSYSDIIKEKLIQELNNNNNNQKQKKEDDNDDENQQQQQLLPQVENIQMDRQNNNYDCKLVITDQRNIQYDIKFSIPFQLFDQNNINNNGQEGNQFQCSLQLQNQKQKSRKLSEISQAAGLEIEFGDFDDNNCDNISNNNTKLYFNNNDDNYDYDENDDDFSNNISQNSNQQFNLKLEQPQTSQKKINDLSIFSENIKDICIKQEAQISQDSSRDCQNHKQILNNNQQCSQCEIVGQCLCQEYSEFKEFIINENTARKFSDDYFLSNYFGENTQNNNGNNENQQSYTVTNLQQQYIPNKFTLECTQSEIQQQQQ